MNILPLWKSHYSGNSILTLEKEYTKDKETIGPRSLLLLAKENNIKEVFVADDGFTGFFQGYKHANELGLNFRFGLRLIITDDASIKKEESTKNESKIILFMRNNDGYRDLIKVWTYANEKGFYYKPRLDWNNLCELLTPNLLLCFPFYDSFIFNNSLTFSEIVPNLKCKSLQKAVFFRENNQLPFDNLIANRLEEFIKTDSRFEIQDAQSIMYEKRSDFKAFMVFKCIQNRSKLEKPEMQHMSSNNFCLEAWKEKHGT